jgi:hypothetical protein
MQSAAANEGDHINVWHRRRLMHLLVVFEKLLASADIADQQFAVNEVMSTDLVAAQKVFEFSGVWCAGSFSSIRSCHINRASPR